MADARLDQLRSEAEAAIAQAATAEELEQTLAGTRDGSFVLDADDGRYTIALARVTYVKRFARETRVGFGSP